MRVLVTGATGQVGNAVAHALYARGDDVVALARDPAGGVRAPAGRRGGRPRRRVRPRIPGAAVDGCELVFNAMGIPEQWVADEGVFDRVNALGAETVVRAAREAGVRRVVQTSTIDVFEAANRRPLRRVAAGDHAQVDRLRALEAARRAAGARRSRGHGARDGEPFRGVRAGPGSASLDKQLFEPVVRGGLPAAHARRHGRGALGRRRERAPAGRRARARRPALHPRTVT